VKLGDTLSKAKIRIAKKMKRNMQLREKSKLAHYGSQHSNFNEQRSGITELKKVRR